LGGAGNQDTTQFPCREKEHEFIVQYYQNTCAADIGTRG